MRTSTLSTGEALLLRWGSPAVGLSGAIYMWASRWVPTEGVGLVVALVTPRFLVKPSATAGPESGPAA